MSVVNIFHVVGLLLILGLTILGEGACPDIPFIQPFLAISYRKTEVATDAFKLEVKPRKGILTN